MENTSQIWLQAPINAFHWERFPSGKCVWHCKDETGATTTRKAPNHDIKAWSVWRDADKQKEADTINMGIQKQLTDRNITLVH